MFYFFFFFFLLVIVVLVVLALVGGGLLGGLVGSVVGSVKGWSRAEEGEGELGAYRGLVWGGCLGVLSGLGVAMVGLSLFWLRVFG